MARLHPRSTSGQNKKAREAFVSLPGLVVGRLLKVRSRCDRRHARGWTIGAGARDEPATTTARTHAGRLTGQDVVVVPLKPRGVKLCRYTWRMRRLAILICAALLLPALPVSAQRLPATVTPEHYDLAFVVDLARERFEGTETIRVKVAEPTARVVLHAVDLELRQV